MNEPTDPASPPPRTRPLLIYDGDCGFCRRWVARWQQRVGDRVDFAASQDVAEQFPDITSGDFAGSVWLVEPDGHRSGGAKAVFGLLWHAPGRRWLLWCYRLVPGLAFVSEKFYRVVARHRRAFGFLTRLLWGSYTGPITYRVTRSVFIRGLGLIYFIALVSLWSQITGLIGEQGILPIQPYLDFIRERSDIERYWVLPTLCWIRADDMFLKMLCGAGAGLSCLVMAGFLQAPCLFMLWVLYLSLTVAGQVFLGYQWDALLLETGLLAVFFAPWSFRSQSARDPEPSVFVRWMFRLLLLKLMFSSGAVKLLSGDEAWRNLTALTYHYETQPLTIWTAWMVHQLPVWFHRESCRLMFIIELLAPWFIFAPRRFRFLACGAMVSLQILIAATGNYTFFNWLSILLCVPLLDDSVWPVRFQSRRGSGRTGRTPGFWRIVRVAVSAPVLGVILLVTCIQILGILRVQVAWPRGVVSVYRWINPLNSVNTYGLFAVMTKTRPEIIVEGSRDGRQWLAYEFKWKAGDPRRRPEFVAPHQPRLDWQMWFAALGNFEGNPWFQNFLGRLLQGSPPVLALLKHNPFPDAPPRYIRAELCDYRFTDWETRRREGTWWTIRPLHPYSPTISLREP